MCGEVLLQLGQPESIPAWPGLGCCPVAQPRAQVHYMGLGPWLLAVWPKSGLVFRWVSSWTPTSAGLATMLAEHRCTHSLCPPPTLLSCKSHQGMI